MLKTCKYCGIVPYNHICPHKEKYKKAIDSLDAYYEARKARAEKEGE